MGGLKLLYNWMDQTDWCNWPQKLNTIEEPTMGDGKQPPQDLSNKERRMRRGDTAEVQYHMRIKED